MTKRSELERFRTQVEATIRRVELWRDAGDPSVPCEQIDLVLARLRRMQEEAEASELPSADKRTKNLTRMIVDQWPLGHSVGKLVSETEEAYCRL